MRSGDDRVAAGLREIEAELRGMLAASVDPYPAGRRVWGRAFELASESLELMWPLWLIWGALTDRVEMQPEERAQAEAAMRRAAGEWLACGRDPRSRKAYFDRWVYDELGIERPDGRRDARESGGPS